MTGKDIRDLTDSLEKGSGSGVNLIETHISWLILTGDYAYKIKKPVRFSFLDFTTLEKRKIYCQKEIQLNRRLTGIYEQVVPVTYTGGFWQFNGDGDIIDYAVRMKRMDNDLEMDRMLENNQVMPFHMKAIAEILVPFHRNARKIFLPFNLEKSRDRFNDLQTVDEFLCQNGLDDAHKVITSAIDFSDRFLEANTKRFRLRVENGWKRDVHGDLHTANIFLTHPPVIFDCIEFNERFRQIDLLEELAFFCMDMESYQAKPLSDIFLDHYCRSFEVLPEKPDQHIFDYFKLYRATVKVKVQALKARQIDDPQKRKVRLKKVTQYYELMKNYLA